MAKLKIEKTTVVPTLNDPERDTLGLLIQAMKYYLVEYFDQLQGSSKNLGALRNNAYQLAEKFHQNCLADIGSLYKLIEAHKGQVDSDMDLYQPYYDAIDFVRETIETAMYLSSANAPNNGTTTIGIAIARDILRDIRTGNVGFTSAEKFEGMKRCGMI